ncbi:MAG TPA: 50S ribosomal protein L33 [Acholeplasmataceae bacterium]|jgi:large subunit ribosomal protein L33|nr:50S ribosomal protein L33 [Acholeplasmataceae bacterium]
MRKKVILICDECLSRNYTIERGALSDGKRMTVKKYCKHCNKHTVHKESK